MSTLTWRNVNDPDFRGVNQGYESFSKLINNATSGLSDGLQDFADAPGKAQDLEAKRSQALLNQQVTGQRLTEDQYAFQRTQNDNVANDDARSVINQMQIAASRGDRNAANELARQNVPLLSATPTGTLNTNLNNVVGHANSDTGARSASFNLGTTIRSDAEKQEYNQFVTKANELGVDSISMRDLIRNSNLSPNVLLAAQQFGESRFPGSFGAVNAADDNAIGAGAGAGNTPAAAASTAISKAAGTVPTSTPASASPNETGSAWAERKGMVESESGGKSNIENSKGYVGLLQFGPDRLTDARKAGVIPANMTKEQFKNSTKEFQNSVADWHFADIDKQADKQGLEQYYGKTINGVVIDRDAIRGMAHLGGLPGTKKFLETNGAYDPSDGKTKISDYGKKFSNNGVVATAANLDATSTPAAAVVDPATSLKESVKSAALSVDEANLELGQRDSENVSANAAEQISKYIRDKTPASAVADDIISSTFRGTNRNVVIAKLTDMVEKSGVPGGVKKLNYKQAGEIMKDSQTSADDGFLNIPKRWDRHWAPGWSTPNFANGVRVDDERIKKAIREVTDGKTNKQVLANRAVRDISTSVTAAQTAYTTAATNLSRLQERINSSPPELAQELAKQLPRFRQEMKMAEALVNDKLTIQRETAEFNPFKRTEEEQKKEDKRRRNE